MATETVYPDATPGLANGFSMGISYEMLWDVKSLLSRTLDLEEVLINEDGGYTSPEARLIDE